MEKRQAKRKQMGKAALKRQRTSEDDSESAEISE